jgi:hypothetical protein
MVTTSLRPCVNHVLQFIKDWVVNVGIWFAQVAQPCKLRVDMISRAFTLSWLFPVSLFVGLVSIQNISAFLPTLVRIFLLVSSY